VRLCGRRSAGARRSRPLPLELRLSEDLRDRDNRGGASDSGGEPEGNGGRLSGISRAHIVGGELEGTSDPGGELEGTSEPAENGLSKEKPEQRFVDEDVDASRGRRRHVMSQT